MEEPETLLLADHSVNIAHQTVHDEAALSSFADCMCDNRQLTDDWLRKAPLEQVIVAVELIGVEGVG